MFKWLERMDPESSGLGRMKRQFSQMLDEGRHVFDAGANAFLGGTDPEAVRKDLFDTDKSINQLERKIRREVVIHGTVHGVSELPVCLVLMSIVKDAERIGDYAKNLFDLSVAAPLHRSDPLYPELVGIKDRISQLLREARGAYESQDPRHARQIIQKGDHLEDQCDAIVLKMLGPETGTPQPVAVALACRYYKRVIAHVVNIVGSIVLTIENLDFYDEDKASRG